MGLDGEPDLLAMSPGAAEQAEQSSDSTERLGRIKLIILHDLDQSGSPLV